MSRVNKSERPAVLRAEDQRANKPAGHKPQTPVHGHMTHDSIMQLQQAIGNQATMQLMSSSAKTEPDETDETLIVQKRENQTGMPDRLKEGLESLSGFDLSDVRVHYNSDKPSHMQAKAYAQGNEIHVASGQEKHLPHEGWHVVQQRQGRVRPTLQQGGVSINDDTSLEREADLMGAKAFDTAAAAVQYKRGRSRK
ncbi:DUF4157 domain-containing protein [Paenibacillus hamazuiensis]|uniref:eCIS core domain-containing protein n=1 Tax=Paenibacillus hamazuiensis TaxID=2936508 RepID=UPI00200C9A50|nr:DUF4157 domain-containing protein [Paenibacillus hamazuiensis]